VKKENNGSNVKESRGEQRPAGGLESGLGQRAIARGSVAPAARTLSQQDGEIAPPASMRGLWKQEYMSNHEAP